MTVRATHVAFDLTDAAAMVRILDEATDFERLGEEFLDSETIGWRWRAAQPVSPPVAMPDELGVRWLLCKEDAHHPPTEARVELNVYEEDVWLFAPVPDRLTRCEKHFTRRVCRLALRANQSRLRRCRNCPEVAA